MKRASDAARLEARYRRCRSQLERRGQQHVLRWWDELGPAARRRLLEQLEAIPWRRLDPLIESRVRRRPPGGAPTNLEPAPVYPARPLPGQKRLYRQAALLGRKLLRAGKVAAFTVAGGQGTRLGYDGPKGTVPVSPVRGKTLFQLFAETVAAARRRYRTPIRWYLMTNPDNHQQTRSFLAARGFFGLPARDVVLFSQQMLPVFDLAGRLLLRARDALALAPDGHGGALRALWASGALRDMRRRGVQIVSYFQVDNPLVKPFDPLFIGLHALSGSQMSTKVVPKAHDREAVGNVCLRQGRLVVIEYSDFPDELARARNPDGARSFAAGSIAIHLLEVDFVARVAAGRSGLPYHRAVKRVAFLDRQGRLRQPGRPNAVKLETFVFDALPRARDALLLEVERAEEFSPVKNATGPDSLATARRDQVRRAARWLEGAGVRVPRRPDGEPDVRLEIAPSYALDAADVRRRRGALPRLRRGQSLYLA